MKNKMTNPVKYYLFVLLLLVIACSNKIENSSEGTVVIGIKGDFDSLNELNASDSDALQVIQNMLFMTLTKLDSGLQFEPYLAESWTFSKDQKELTFVLRDGVFWTDGTPTTTEDVLYTYQLATNPDVAYPASSRFDLTEKVEIIDKKTIRFYFKQPYPDALFDTQIPILPKHILEHSPDYKFQSFNRKPIGNGPFILKEWIANRQLVFEANKNFYERPLLDKVIFSIIPEENVLITNLLSKNVDIVPYVNPVNIKQIKKKGRIGVKTYEGKSFTFVGWNTAHPLLSVPLRQALTHAINKREIIATLFDGYAKPAKGPFTPINWAYNNAIEDIDFDPQKALELFKENGWDDSDGDGYLDKLGKDFFITIKINTGSQIRKDVAVLVQAQLKDIGVKVNIEQLDWNLFIDHVFIKKNFDAVVLAWDTDFSVNPTDLWHSNAIENGYNFISYNNPKIDYLLEKARFTNDPFEAQKAWDEFQKIIINDCPYTFLFVPENIIAYNDKVQGCVFDARGFLVNVSEWWIVPEEEKLKSE